MAGHPLPQPGPGSANMHGDGGGRPARRLAGALIAFLLAALLLAILLAGAGLWWVSFRGLDATPTTPAAGEPQTAAPDSSPSLPPVASTTAPADPTQAQSSAGASPASP